MLGLLVSSARDPRDCPDAAWLAVLGLLVSGARELWEGPNPDWLAVLGWASSKLALEAVRGSRKVKGTAPQAWSRIG